MRLGDLALQEMRLGDLADRPWFIVVSYVLVLLPIAFYGYHDVTDSHWRGRSTNTAFYRVYAVVNFVFATWGATYFASQILADEPDYKEACAVIVALLVNVYVALKVYRGFAINAMLLVLARLMRLRGDCVDDQTFQGYAGNLADRLSSRFMDDDYPGDAPRIRWDVLCLRKHVMWWWTSFTIHRFQAIRDATEFALFVVVWAWRSLCQTGSHLNEREHLWWLVRGLDHASVVGLMHAQGDEFRELDAVYNYKNVADFRPAELKPYSPIDAVKRELEHHHITADPNDGPDCFKVLTQCYQYTTRVAWLWLGTVLHSGEKYAKIRSRDQKFDGKSVDRKRFLIMHHDDFKAENELMHVTRASAISLLTHSALQAAPTLSRLIASFFCMRRRPAVRQAAGLPGPQLKDFTKGAFLRASKDGSSWSKEDRRVKYERRSDGERVPQYTLHQLRHLRYHAKMMGEEGDFSEVAEHLQTYGLPRFDDWSKKDPPPFLVAYCTSIFALIRHAAEATEAEQLQCIADMPLEKYNAVGTPRLAFIGLASLHRQVATIARMQYGPSEVVQSTTSQASAGTHGSSNRRHSGNQQSPTLMDMDPPAWEILFKGCCGLHQVADQLMLHAEDMIDEDYLMTWRRLEPALPHDVDKLAVERLLFWFMEAHGWCAVTSLLAGKMLLDLWGDGELEQKTADACLGTHSLRHITLMMAITFAAVVCCGQVMLDRTDSGSDVKTRQVMRNSLLTMAALHHATSIGWEYMLWQTCHSDLSNNTMAINELQTQLDKKRTLQGWGIQGQMLESQDVHLMPPAAVAKEMALRFMHLSPKLSIKEAYHGHNLKSGLSEPVPTIDFEVGAHLLRTFKWFTSCM